MNEPDGRLRILIAIACLLNGFLAGENIFRYGMEVPGWRHINIAEWGEYSRHADLGYGVFILPFEAIAGTILVMIVSGIILKNGDRFKSAAFSVHTASIFALAGIILTFFAAPYMLSVRTIGNDPVLLQETFNHFHFWGFFRAIAQVLAFCFCVPALGKIYSATVTK